PPRRPAGPGQGLAPARLPGLDQGAAHPGRGRGRAGQRPCSGGQGRRLGGQRHRHALPDPVLGPLPGGRGGGPSRGALAEAERSGVSSLAATAYRVLARVAAHRGDLEEARRFVDAATKITTEEGSLLPRAVDCISRAIVDMLAGDLAAAEEVLRNGHRQLEEMGGTGPRVNVATLLARVRLLRGRNDDAEEITRTCERLAATDQADAQVKCRSIRAIAVARRGDPGEAERLAREAVYLAGKTDQLDSRAEAHLDLAEVLLLGGRGREAEHELGRAIALYQEKGNEVGERNARRLLARTR